MLRSSRIQRRTRKIRKHGWSNRTSSGRSDRAGTLDADSSAETQPLSTLVSWTTMTRCGRSKSITRRTGWNKTFKSGTYRVLQYGIVLRDYPKQFVSLATAKSVPTNVREFLSWAQRHYRIDVAASTVERKTSGPASAGTCPGGWKEFSREGSNTHFTRLTFKICCTGQKEERHPQRQDPATSSHQHTDHRRATHTTRTRQTYCVDCGTYIDSVPREILNAIKATRSASSNRNEEHGR